jgi:site-specific DNA-methyltransferase (adenine-specific)
MVKLLKGDCLEVMKDIESGSVDAIITDPPYGTTACKWDSVIPFEPMWEQLNRVIKPNGAIVLFGSEPFSSALRMSNIKNYKYDWVWHKNNKTGFLNAKKMPLKNIETISIFQKRIKYNPQGLKPFNRIVKRGSNGNNYSKSGVKNLQEFTNYPTQYINFKCQGKTVHPTQKPVLLMEYLIKTYTNENETVLDFTMGSGSTGVACVNANRNFIGIEQDENYFNIAKKRIEETEYKLF